MLRPCYISVLTWFILGVKSEKLLPGHCPPVTSMAEFDRDRYMGVWYQQATIKAILKDDVTCTHFLYKPISGGGFQMEARKLARLTNGPVSVFGIAELGKLHKRKPGSYKVTYFGDLVNEVSNYYILSTDYTSISVVWSCDPFYNFWNRQNVQVLTRSRTMNTTRLLVSTLRALLPQHLDQLFDFISPVDQTECEEIVL